MPEEHDTEDSVSNSEALPQSFSTKVRSPTATAWALFLLSAIVCGESHSALNTGGNVGFLVFSLEPAQVQLAFIAFGVLTVFGLIWLLALYVFAGSLAIAQSGDGWQLVRVRRPLFKTQRVAAELGAWNIRIDAHAEQDLARGTFRRLELVGPDLSEVLLFGDIKDATGLLRALGPHKDAFNGFAITLRKSPPEQDSSAPRAPGAQS